MIGHGDIKVSKLFIGNIEISQAYVGDTKVFPDEVITWEYELTVSPTSLTFPAAGGTQTLTVVSRRQKMVNGVASGEYEDVPYSVIVNED